jgi:hypothetical protein
MFEDDVKSAAVYTRISMDDGSTLGIQRQRRTALRWPASALGS